MSKRQEEAIAMQEGSLLHEMIDDYQNLIYEEFCDADASEATKIHAKASAMGPFRFWLDMRLESIIAGDE